MEVKFSIPQFPFGDNKKLYSGKQLVLKPGFTPLVGCNGSGKTTLILLLKEQLRDREGAVLIDYNDRSDGGHSLIDRMMLSNHIEDAMGMFISSEGERIYRGVGNLISQIAKTIRKQQPKEFWITMDCVGSGLSIDYICEIKDIVPFIMEQNPDVHCFFVMPTNEYEFARGEDCIDVTTLKRVKFKDYEDYRDYVLKTRKKKDERGW